MELEVVPENTVPVLHKEQMDYKAKKANRRCWSGRGAGGGRNEWSKILKLIRNGDQGL